MRERLKAKPSPEVEKYLSGPALESDAKLNFTNMMRINEAHALMLCRQGIIGKEPARKLLAEMRDLMGKGTGVLAMTADYEDLFYNIEQYLIGRLGMETAGQMHTARSRNDLGITVIRMGVRDAVLGLIPAMLKVRQATLELAEANKDTIMTGYTHMQPAQPMTLGYYLAGVAEAMERDAARIFQAYARLNTCAMGSCAFAGTGFPVDRFYTAKLLGFDGPLENSLDAVVGRDFLLELTADLAIFGSTVNRYAQDLYIWHTNEFGYVELDDSLAGSSSIMPQKKNPHTFEHVKAKSAHLLACFVDLTAVLKGIPFGHCRDMGEMMGPFYNAVHEAEAMMGLLNANLRGLTIHWEGMKSRADSNFCTATELSDELVKTEGIPFRVAYQIVGSVVGQCVDKGLGCRDITTQMLDEAGLLFAGRAFHWPQEKVSRALDSGYSVENKESYGAPGPKALGHTLQVLQEGLKRDEAALEALKQAQKAARDFLEGEIDQLLA